jgi:serine/threonine protein kinase
MSLPRGSDEEFRHARELFDRAMEVDPAQRDAFIVNACGSDTRLREIVRKLVDADLRGDQFLEEPTRLSDSASDRQSYLASGDTIGQYRIERTLGEGGMGVVYLAQDSNLNRMVAIKALSPAYTRDPRRRERFRREAEAASKLNHPGIPIVFEFRDHQGDLFMVAEYVQGETLRSEIARGATGVARIIETANGIASALAVAHDAGIVHRDVKPENIMRTPEGQIKILDFGLASLRDADSIGRKLTDDGSVLGTLAYMAPEQLRRDPIDGRGDLFSLGVLLYEMATGVHPFAGGSMASTIARILEPERPPLRTLPFRKSDGAGSAPMRAALEVIIRRCLRKQPEDRFASAHDLMGALERARDGRSDSGVIFTGARGPQRWWKVHHLATCIAYGGLMIPMWLARLAIDKVDGAQGRLGLVLFLATLAAVVASIVLRLHLWFTASSIPGQWARQFRHATPWLRLSDSLAVLGFLIAGGALIAVNRQEGLAAILICAGIVTGLSFSVIEPATTRAAFDDNG